MEVKTAALIFCVQVYPGLIRRGRGCLIACRSRAPPHNLATSVVERGGRVDWPGEAVIEAYFRDRQITGGWPNHPEETNIKAQRHVSVI